VGAYWFYFHVGSNLKKNISLCQVAKRVHLLTSYKDAAPLAEVQDCFSSRFSGMSLCICLANKGLADCALVNASSKNAATWSSICF
jgi:hypothetical protein